MTPTSIITSERMIAHDPGPGHPERPERLRALIDHLRAAGPACEWGEARPATRDEVARVHSQSYIDKIDSLIGKHIALDADTITSPRSVECAFLAAGAAMQAVDCVMHDSGRTAFALVRPPGHHATSDRAGGFCLFNNIAIAAEHALAFHKLKRILIVDWDVHHGDGTQDIFWRRNDVLFFSTHQFPFWPGTGAAHETGDGDGRGFSINVPLPAGSNDEVFVAAFERVLVPAAEHYRPQLVLVSAGFDAHHEDPLADMQITEAGFATLASIVKTIALRHCEGRVAMILEGGYSIAGLTRSVEAVITALSSDATVHTAAPVEKRTG